SGLSSSWGCTPSLPRRPKESLGSKLWNPAPIQPFGVAVNGVAFVAVTEIASLAAGRERTEDCFHGAGRPHGCTGWALRHSNIRLTRLANPKSPLKQSFHRTSS